MLDQQDDTMPACGAVFSRNLETTSVSDVVVPHKKGRKEEAGSRKYSLFVEKSKVFVSVRMFGNQIEGTPYRFGPMYIILYACGADEDVSFSARGARLAEEGVLDAYLEGEGVKREGKEGRSTLTSHVLRLRKACCVRYAVRTSFGEDVASVILSALEELYLADRVKDASRIQTQKMNK